MKFTRRCRKLLALTLFVSQLGGARVHAVTQGDATRTYFDSGITVKVLVKKLTGQTIGKPATSPSLGQTRAIHTASDFKTVKTSRRVSPVSVSNPAPSAVAQAARRPGADLAAKLGSDFSPTQPSHLHSKN